MFSRFVQHAGNLHVSRIALAELYAWERCRNYPEQVLELLLNDVQIVEFDNACALTFGRIRRELLSRGFVASSIDLLIAATAISHDFTLVTHNTTDFLNIPNLKFVDWLQS